MSNFPAGSKVIITRANTTEPYKNGDIFTVARFDAPGVSVTLPSGKQRYLASHEFEAYTEPKKIKVIKSNHPREYVVGDILEVDVAGGGVDRQGDVRVTNNHGSNSVVFKGQWEYYTEPAAEPLAEWEKELLDPNYTPRQIELSDIQEGDTIKAEYNQHGVKYTREGVAQNKIGDWNIGWSTYEGDYIANSQWKGAKYTLLERPEPVNPFAEAKVGSLAREIAGSYNWYKTADNEWKFITKTGARLSNSTKTDAAMNSTSFELFHVVK